MKYVVQKGDSLSSIARRLNVNMRSLADFNKIKNVNKIFIGQEIKVPEQRKPAMAEQVSRAKQRQPKQSKDFKINFSLFPRAAAAEPERSSMYSVKKGDSFSKIAKSNNLTVQQLKELNPQIKNVNRINIGDQIKLEDDRGFFERAKDSLFGEGPKDTRPSGSIIPENIQAYLRYVGGNLLGLSPGEDIDASTFGREQQDVLVEAIKNAKKAGRTTVGYEDYPVMKSGETPNDFYFQKRKPRSLLDLGLESVKDPSFEMFTTLGKFSFKDLGSDQYMIENDRYDFDKSKSGGAKRKEAKDAYGSLTHLGQDITEDENYSFNIAGIVKGSV